MNSSSFNDNLNSNVPVLPNIHYYNKVAPPKSSNNEQNFIDTMNTQCPIGSGGCLNDGDCDKFTNDLYNNNFGTDSKGTKITTLLDDIQNSIKSSGKSPNTQQIANQIQYLTCQVARARARNYDSDKLNVSQSAISLKEVFNKFSNLKPYLIVIFFVTIYLLIYGFFSSLDVCISILTSINDISLSYWLGLLCGLIVPIVILTINFKDVLCSKVVGEDKYDITTNATGTPVSVSAESKTLDYSMITIFIVLIFAFTALLFILKKDVLGDKIYYALVSSIFVIISVFIYLFYSMTPYFVSANQKNILNRKEEPIQIYIDDQQEVSKITSNKDINSKVNKLYISVVLFIFTLAILFFVIRRKGVNNSFVNGLFGAGALLILPILWVFNYTIGIRYFYIYPVFIIVMRFIRYAGMVLLYMMTERNDELKDNFSDNLLEELDDIKNYTPSWSLIGVDLLKTVMNMNGFNNELSEKVVNNNNSKKNISSDKYFSSLIFLRLLLSDNISDNKKGIIYASIILVLTLIFGSIILYGVLNVEDVKNKPYKVE